MIDLLKYIVENATGAENVEVSETQDEGKDVYTIKVDKDHIGMVIGKGGTTIKAIRNIAKVRSTLEKKFVYINVEEI